MARPQQDYGRRVAKQVIQTGAEAAGQHLCNYRAFLHICKPPVRSPMGLRGLISTGTPMAAPSGRIREDEHMTITQAIFAAFTQCRTKSHLSLHSDAVAENALGQGRQHWDQLYQRNGSSRLRARVLDAQLYVGTPAVEAIQQQQYRVILDCTLQTSDVQAQVHGLELVRSPRTKGRSAYVPIRFVSTERISTADRRRT